MPEKKFNLLHESWILVMHPDAKTEDVSILELFRRAPDWQGFAGELPTQDNAILRLLLAILHAVFSRYDLAGKFAPLSSPAEALARWSSLWNKQGFPEEVITEYLLHFEDRFCLFHPQFPFYQVAELEKVKTTGYAAAKLNGELAESSNKTRLFSQRMGASKNALSYAEAARWLIYVNAFDDTAAKPSVRKSGLPSPGAGWLGKLGLISALGDNLFETLLLNLVLLPDGSNKLWGEERPVWEREEVRTGERTGITMPDNPSELLTLQSRRLLLERQGNLVVGYRLLGGDFFPKENAFFEQMTLWRNAAKKKTDPPEYHPRRHDPGRQLWRDFAVLVSQRETGRRPGVIGWLARLKAENLIPRSHFRFQIAAVKYGDKDFFTEDVLGDSISFNAGLLTALGEDWINRIIGEIDTADRLVNQVGQLAQNLAMAAGDTDGFAQRNASKEEAYYRLDEPFRRWLEEIDPLRDGDRKDEVCEQWWVEARRIVQDLGRELVKQSGPQAFAGRTVADKKKVERRYTAPEAYNYFLARTSNRESLQERRAKNV